MAIRTAQPKQEKHEHAFGYRRVCDCKAYLVSPETFKQQANDWDEYFEKVKQGDAYKGFFSMITAWKEGDMATVKDLHNEARQRLASGNHLPKPSFPDPLTIYHEKIIKNREVVDYIFYPPKADDDEEI